MEDKFTEKIRAARIKMIISHPFFGQMATNLRLIEDNEGCKTAATDGVNFYYNETFIDSLNKQEMIFVFGHEVLHNVFEHHFRRGNRNPLIWNIACDYVVNLVLVQSHIGTPPKLSKGGVLLDKKYENMYAEEVYDIFFKEIKDSKHLQALVDRLLDDHPDLSGKTQKEIEELKAKIKEDLLKASQSSGAGNIPEGVLRHIKNITEPKLDWRDIIRQNIISVLVSDSSFYRSNKKNTYADDSVIFAGRLKENAIKIVISMDMSGSITDGIANEFLSEIEGIVSQFREYTIDIWSFDTQVYNHVQYTSDCGEFISEYEPKGGGGTMFECNWDYMKSNDINPELFIMFTDMFPCGGWGDPDYCDTIFVSRGNKGTVAPFGITVEMD